MTVPAAADGQAPASRVVRVPVTAELLLTHLLRLDGELADVAIEHRGGTKVLVLYVDYPGAPEDAAELLPVYTQTACQGQANCPGQVSLTGLEWKPSA